MLPMVLERALIRFFLSHCSFEKGGTLKAFLFSDYYVALDKTRARVAGKGAWIRYAAVFR